MTTNPDHAKRQNLTVQGMWRKVNEYAEESLDLSCLDAIEDEPVHDEIVRLPYEGTPSFACKW